MKYTSGKGFTGYMEEHAGYGAKAAVREMQHAGHLKAAYFRTGFS